MTHALTIEIGEMPIVVRTDSKEFVRMLEDRYGEFVVGREGKTAELSWQGDPGHAQTRAGSPCQVEPPVPPSLSPTLFLDVDLVPPGAGHGEEDKELSVRRENGFWVMERGDFRAEWDPASGHGWVRQSAAPYAIDGVLRILHSLVLARQGGFLVHAASAVRDGCAFVFAGVSGTGKTTISRLAPPDVTLLTDEISYLRDTGYGTRGTGDAMGDTGKGVRDKGKETGDTSLPTPGQAPPIQDPLSPIPYPVSRIPAFRAFGTPFAGELARLGQKVEAPLAALFLLKQGAENRIEPLTEGQAARELLRHVLFFAQDEELVGMVFQTVCEFVRRVPVRRLVFKKDASVWEEIREQERLKGKG